jgi:hypothetical protein
MSFANGPPALAALPPGAHSIPGSDWGRHKVLIVEELSQLVGDASIRWIRRSSTKADRYERSLSRSSSMTGPQATSDFQSETITSWTLPCAKTNPPSTTTRSARTTPP